MFDFSHSAQDPNGSLIVAIRGMNLKEVFNVRANSGKPFNGLSEYQSLVNGNTTTPFWRIDAD